jgi:hypothetical protein
MLLALTFPIIDTDRMTPSSGGGGRVSARVWIAVAYVALLAGWLCWRWIVR